MPQRFFTPQEASVDGNDNSSKQPQGVPIGTILVQQGVLTERQVQHILTIQKAAGRPFGDLAERLYGVNPSVIEDAWVEQYVRTVGTVDLADQEIDTRCLRMLNRRQAWQFHLLPMNTEANGMLPGVNMATSADDLLRAVNFSTRRIDEVVYLHIAERDQLREFLMKHYPVPEHIAQYAAKM